MKSLCIKTNSQNIIDYLLENISSLNIDSLYISNHKFKIYENVIVHFMSENTDFFYDKIATTLTDAVIKFYQEKLLKRILEYNYFYFSLPEKKIILQIANDFIEEDTITSDDNFFAIYYAILDYIKQNKSIVLDGFVNFRLQNYMKNLDYIVDISVNKYLIEKEYNEFVSILKLYVSMTPYNSPVIHLIYHNGSSILLDNEKNIIETDDDIFKAKYLSDISFSSNDYALNTLLNLTPKKLIIHLVDNESEDEFINTLKLIFENRCVICTDCNICSTFKLSASHLRN